MGKVSEFEYDQNTTVGRWNIENPAKAIMVGDVLLSVNKESGDDYQKFFRDANSLSLELSFLRMRRLTTTGSLDLLAHTVPEAATAPAH